MATPVLPIPDNEGSDIPKSEDPAVKLIRGRLANLYSREPDAKEELREIEQTGAVSKHQLKMKSLQESGLSIAEIQTAWHDYYQSLPDPEKHEVWQEFYSNQNRSAQFFQSAPEPPKTAKTAAKKPTAKPRTSTTRKPPKAPQSVAELKQKLAAKVSADGRLSPKDHLKSLLFGLGTAAAVGFVIMFVMFNELFLAPFITPSRSASATPLITDPSGATTVGAEPRIIIPKINVDAPLVLDAASNAEDDIQSALERGVTLYPNTGKPGEKSNPIIFGHSSNNLFNSGAYKFVFVMLNKLENGDTFIIHYNSKQYVYRVFNKKVVRPTEVSVLREHPVPSMMTLITCDPPGTNTNRLIIQAEQISPDPKSNVANSQKGSAEETPVVIPSDSKPLWRRIFGWIAG